MKNIEIVVKKLDELVPYENNPRNNEEAVSKVAASIEEFGFKVPIIVDADGVIVAGHTRFLAAKELGIDMVFGSDSHKAEDIAANFNKDL